jgi:hypothetical protein
MGGLGISSVDIGIGILNVGIKSKDTRAECGDPDQYQCRYRARSIDR